ncbi:MAG: lipoate--protein ligase, partial [bacterium]
MNTVGRRQFRSLTDDPFWNLALEVWLLRHLPESAAWLLTYVNAPAVVLGCNQNPWRETDPKALAAADIRLVRRTSGGGAVYHDPGNLNVSLLTLRSRHAAHLLEDVLRETLAALGITAAVTPRHGLECGGRKISGGAFQFTGHTVLH